MRLTSARLPPITPAGAGAQCSAALAHSLITARQAPLALLAEDLALELVELMPLRLELLRRRRQLLAQPRHLLRGERCRPRQAEHRYTAP